MELTRRFAQEQYASALDAWAFLDLNGKQPSFSSPFGDVFFESADGWWFLDIVGGKLTREWQSGAELEATLNTPDGQDAYLMSGLASAADSAGLHPGEDQVLSFVVSPVLGGAVHPDNLEVSDMVVTVNIYGQIHEQTCDLPDGTSIDGFTIS